MAEKERGMYNRRLGAAGEDMACEIMAIKGYSIVKRNYRCREGEIDIIVHRGNEIGFVEVKSRLNAGYARPGEAVDEKKKRRLARTAEYYLRELERRGYHPSVIKFHVVEISAEHTADAF